MKIEAVRLDEVERETLEDFARWLGVATNCNECPLDAISITCNEIDCRGCTESLLSYYVAVERGLI